jgi:RHS repeat-associated protein
MSLRDVHGEGPSVRRLLHVLISSTTLAAAFVVGAPGLSATAAAAPPAAPPAQRPAQTAQPAQHSTPPAATGASHGGGHRTTHPVGSLHHKGDDLTGKPGPLRQGHATPQPIRGGNGGWAPSDLWSAYSLPSWQLGYGRTVGIVDAYDDPTVESDLATYRSFYNLPPCTTANGCFRRVAQDGSSNYPAPAPATNNWAAETALDVEMVSATCPNCHIVLVEANSDSTFDLLAGVDEAVSLGVNAVNMSWGAGEYPGETTDDGHFAHPGVAFVASSGDYGYGPTIWPAASPNVFAVGATDLNTDAFGNWYESAWAGSTSGCSQYEPKPAYQHDGGCSTRTTTDISAVGGTALSMYLTYPQNGWSTGWQGAGGTSASAPIVAGILVLAPQDTTATSGPGNWYNSAYTPGAFSVNDVQSGSTGSCGGYLCDAGPGYDGPTGLGTPDGLPPSLNSRAPSELWGAFNSGEGGKKPCTSGDPVVCATGDLTETATDLNVAGRGRALAFTRTYNGLDAASASSPDALGWGWTDSYAMSLTTDATSGAVTVHQENGATVTFTPQGSDYVAPGWVIASLRRNTDGTFTYALPDQTSDVFSATGQLVSESDRNGYLTTLTYDGSGRLSTVTDPAGRALTLAYNGVGQLATVIDPIGRTVSYGYDANGNLTTVTDPAGNVTQFGYDASHRLTTLTDPRGGVTTNSYDTSNRVVSQTDPMNRVMTFAYTPTTTTITDPTGNVTVETYNAYLQLIKVVHGSGTSDQSTSTFTYDAYSGEEASATDGNGHTTFTQWDAQGNEINVTNALNRYTAATYDAANDLTSVTDNSGVTTTYGYDGNHNLTSTSTPLGGSSGTATTTYGYDPAHPGDMTSITDPDGHVSHLRYDPNGDLVSVTDPDGNVASATYNGIGWRTSSISPKGNVLGGNPAAFTTSFGYDADGRPTTVTDPLGHVSRTSYDADGNPLTVTDALGHVTSYSYDADNERTKVTNPDSTSSGTGYNADGLPLTQTDGNNHTTSYGYDGLNRLASATDPLHRTTSYHYDTAGNIRSLTTPTGATTTYGYDVGNELTSITYSDGKTPNVAYSYDADGRRYQMTDGSGTTTYGYDALGRLTAQIDGAGNFVGYGYDLASRLTTLTYPSGQAVTRGYDGAGLLTSVTDGSGNTTRYSYDPNGNVGTETRPNSTAATYSYDNADRITSISDTGPAGTILNLPYTYGASNLLASANVTGTSQPVTQTYGYDSRDRITSATVPVGTTTVPSDTYSYDAADEITKITLNGQAATTLTHDAADELTTATNAVGTTTYTNDQNGNRTKMVDAAGNTTKYTYDQANRLTSFNGPTASAANTAGAPVVASTYSYNGDGLRVGKGVTVNGIGVSLPFTWDLAASTPLLLSDGTNEFVYGCGDQPIEQVSLAGTATWLHTDRQGSVRALSNSAGTVTATTTYDPYGRTISATGVATSPLGYDGQYTDSESGLVYLRARYYEPSTGQFLTVDPLNALTRQPYAYGASDPLNRWDPTGLCNANPFSASFWTQGNCISDAAGAVGDWVSAHGDTLVDLGAGITCIVAGPESFGAACVPAAAIAAGYSTYTTVKDDIANGDGITKIIEDSLLNIAKAGAMLTPAAVEVMAERVIAEEGVANVSEWLQLTKSVAGGIDKLLTVYGLSSDLIKLLPCSLQ